MKKINKKVLLLLALAFLFSWPAVSVWTIIQNGDFSRAAAAVEAAEKPEMVGPLRSDMLPGPRISE